MCCWQAIERSVSCELAGDSSGFWSHGEDVEELERFQVFVEARSGEVASIRLYDDRCPVDAGAAAVRFMNPADDEIIEFLDAIAWSHREKAGEALQAISLSTSPNARDRLTSHLTDNGNEEAKGAAAFHLARREGGAVLPLLKERLAVERETKMREKIVFAVAQIDSPAAFSILRRMIRTDRDVDVRTNAIFWVGQRWGERGLDLLDEALADDSKKVREQAVFALSQIDGTSATERLLELVRDDDRRDVRRSALFWLAQRASRKVGPAIEDVIRSNEDEEIVEAAVFALTQMKNDEGIPYLIRLAESHESTEVRKKAIFWLGQSESEEAVALLERLVLEQDR